MKFLLKNHISDAAQSLKANRSRSFLTVLGISIGVASIVTILSLTGGVKRIISDQIQQYGDDLIVVRPTYTNHAKDIFSHLTDSMSFASSSLTLQDVASVKSLDETMLVAPVSVSQHELLGDNDAVSSVIATTPDFFNIFGLTARDDDDLNSSLSQNTIVLGSRLSVRLFDSVDTIGKKLIIKGESFMVVGVLSPIADPININNVNLDEAMFMSIEKSPIVDKTPQIQQINLRTRQDPATVANLVDQAVAKNHKNAKDFEVLSGESIYSPAENILSLMSITLSIVAGISLVVGGIGVMNIMLVTVAERTREIGIRKAVGAWGGQIMVQFLIEALILSIMGGVLGFVFGYLGASAVALFTPILPFISLDIVKTAFSISIAVGVVFGLYPAFRAARKKPVDCLKYYR
ncbi:MAG: ABC transporter permease [Candidatus Nomurabacteria bacterium]|jgi:ABC-type antimicrobial peptide transport system permease subunit|nr:ABC transporter permease [Candidatus Nomurabacteria bacterium]